VILMTATLRQAWVAIRFLLVMTVVLGVLYPLGVYAVGRVVPARADGSYVTTRDGVVVGSALVGQQFHGAQYFHSRPSAAGADGYDALSSSGSNLGPNNEDLVAAVQERIAAVAEEEGVSRDLVPADAVTASGSGLDPHISPAYADLQVARVARERGLPVADVQRLVAESTDQPVLGFLGDPGVNVLRLNLALDELG
jgi:K+-transporting ATPase ATPase C chain